MWVIIAWPIQMKTSCFKTWKTCIICFKSPQATSRLSKLVCGYIYIYIQYLYIYIQSNSIYLWIYLPIVDPEMSWNVYQNSATCCTNIPRNLPFKPPGVELMTPTTQKKQKTHLLLQNKRVFGGSVKTISLFCGPNWSSNRQRWTKP